MMKDDQVRAAAYYEPVNERVVDHKEAARK
jgi:hypothetical protein